MKLIVGLGNPGKEYEKTRHNTGFMVLDELADQLNVSVEHNKFKGLYTKFKYQGEDVILLKPQTFMNLSGESVRQMMDFFKIDLSDILVIYDDMDMPVGKLRLRESGSAGGHNGIKNIIMHTGSQNFKRIRVGIGRHPHMKVVDYVLSRFREDELSDIQNGIKRASEAVIDFLDHDFSYAMNKYN
ncbi:MAG: aminoacyl-tRNA hydrolase [Faecalibacillus sp.]